jgi:hypothetical protein
VLGLLISKTITSIAHMSQNLLVPATGWFRRCMEESLGRDAPDIRAIASYVAILDQTDSLTETAQANGNRQSPGSGADDDRIGRRELVTRVGRRGATGGPWRRGAIGGR